MIPGQFDYKCCGDNYDDRNFKLGGHRCTLPRSLDAESVTLCGFVVSPESTAM